MARCGGPPTVEAITLEEVPMSAVTRRMFAATILFACAVPLAGCGESNGNKAGGQSGGKPTVLRLGDTSGATPGQVAGFIDEVGRLSHGSLRIEVEFMHRRDPLAESRVLDDVKDGTLELAWVGARIFDTLGTTTFQPLLAPFLVDNHELQRRVFESGLPTRMLENVATVGVVPIGVLPGPMRKVLGIQAPLLRPADFTGRMIGGADNVLARKTFAALGAGFRVVPAAGLLEGLDGLEQQFLSIQGNHYDLQAAYVTANLNLWPRVLVIVMGKAAFDALSDDQQEILRDAAQDAIPGALEASRAEDVEGAAVVCKRGLRFAEASEADLRALRTTVQPVYAAIAATPAGKDGLEQIMRLKQGTAARPDTEQCDAASGSGAAQGSVLDGVYEMTMTRAEAVKNGVGQEANYDETLFELTIADGSLTMVESLGGRGAPQMPAFDGTFSLYRDRIEIEVPQESFTITSRWELEGNELRFIGMKPASDAAVWGLHPWIRVRDLPSAAPASKLEGVYRTTVTRDELARSPLLYDSTEINDENWGELTLRLERGFAAFEQRNSVRSTATTGTYRIEGSTLVLEFAEGVNAGETFAMRWSLFDDTLTFERDEALGAVPTPYLINPWRRVG